MQKLSARHKRNRTSINFLKTFLFKEFFMAVTYPVTFIMSAVLICKWTLSHYDDDDDDHMRSVR